MQSSQQPMLSYQSIDESKVNENRLIQRHDQELKKFGEKQQKYISYLNELTAFIKQHYPARVNILNNLYEIPAANLLSSNKTATIYYNLIKNLIKFKRAMPNNEICHIVLHNAITLTSDMANAEKIWNDSDFAEENMGAFSNAMQAATTLIKEPQKLDNHANLTTATEQMKFSDRPVFTELRGTLAALLLLGSIAIAIFCPPMIGISLSIGVAVIAGCLIRDAFIAKNQNRHTIHDHMNKTANSLDTLSTNPQSIFYYKEYPTDTTPEPKTEVSQSVAFPPGAYQPL